MHLFRCLCVVLLVALQDVSASHLILRNISIPEGLSNMNITSFAQDDLGYMWIGTRRGLNRYDGYEFTHFFNDVDDNINTFMSIKIQKIMNFRAYFHYCCIVPLFVCINKMK